MKTLVGDRVVFFKKDGTYIYMAVMEETLTDYIGYDEERINFSIEKADIEVIHYLDNGQTKKGDA